MKRFINRKGARNFFFVSDVEAGIVLTGTEIKSIREGKINFKDSFARIRDGEVWLLNMHISPFEKGNQFNHDPERPRKLLLKRHEISRLERKVNEQGLTLVPKELYINENGLCKVLIALAKGKKLYDKREDLKQKDIERELKQRERQG